MAFSPGYFFIIMILAVIVALVYILATYNNCEKIALSSVNAKEADPVRFRQLHNLVESMAIASGLPKPKVYIMPGNRINAFATGRNPDKAVICVTETALQKLNKQELEGVIGHEMSHIANYDVRFMTLVAVVVGAIAIFSQIFLRSLWFDGGRSSGNSDSGGNAIFMIIALVVAVLAPIIVMLVQLSISRKREYMADAGSVSFTRYPPGLINALKKINQEIKSEKELKVSGAVTPLLFAPNVRMEVTSLLATHPAIKDRIKKLEEM